ncbi:MAG: DUF3168 domain-containing protein [Chloroflexota bacterium]
MAASVEQALVAKLKATAAVNDAVAGSVFTFNDSQDAGAPSVIITKLGAEGRATLNGGRALRKWSVQLDCYADTELEAEAIGALVRETLAPAGAAPWRDLDAGVHGAFFEDSTAGETEDGVRVQSETFSVWFQPT